jgi:hypothetical protein
MPAASTTGCMLTEALAAADEHENRLYEAEAYRLKSEFAAEARPRGIEHHPLAVGAHAERDQHWRAVFPIRTCG